MPTNTRPVDETIATEINWEWPTTIAPYYVGLGSFKTSTVDELLSFGGVCRLVAAFEVVYILSASQVE